MISSIKLIFSLVFCFLLAACGGGSTEPCSKDASLFITTIWKTNGVLQGNRVIGKVGVAMTAVPTITGIPAGCTPSFAKIPEGTGLPNGLSVDAKTGIISGTPTASVSGLFGVDMSLPGYSSARILNSISIAN